MNSSYPHPQMMAPSPFLYYAAGDKDNTQRGHFTQHPAAHMQAPIYQHCLPTVPSTPIYHSRPSSSSSEHTMMQQMPPQQQLPMHIYTHHPQFQGYITPMASPSQMYPGPQVHLENPRYHMLEQERYEQDYFTPCTPPMSASNSSMGSPCSVDGLLTPDGLAPSMFRFQVAKNDCMNELDGDYMQHWQRNDTEEMTPGE